MDNIFLFDVDGTLTEPRQEMTQDFANLFRVLVGNNLVYLVSGSDLAKLKEQVPKDILDSCAGIFSSSANQLDISDELIYINELEVEEGLEEFLETFLQESAYEIKTGNHIEHRPGMINFSVVGRNASPTEREAYFKWDKRKLERKKFAVMLMVMFPGMDAKIGGEISVDIYPSGYDKRQSVSYLREHHPSKRICFFGDKTGPHGNDYSVVISLAEDDNVHSVLSYLETRVIIDRYLRGETFG
jgi:phosphomannomutase